MVKHSQALKVELGAFFLNFLSFIAIDSGKILFNSLH